MSKDFDDLTNGQTKAVIQKIGGPDAAMELLRGELIVQPKIVPVSDAANGGITFAKPSVPDAKTFIEEMEAFYGEVYGHYLPKVKLPPVREGFSWGLVMIHVPIETELAAMKAQFPIYRWTDENLDTIVSSVRSAVKKPYAVWFRDRVEADTELASRSYNDLVAAKANCITLPERIRLERWFYWKTKKHLDPKSITLCGGSRSSVGSVPDVNWDGSGLYVNWFPPQVAFELLRAREAVS